jgi:hypothetical protein
MGAEESSEVDDRKGGGIASDKASGRAKMWRFGEDEGCESDAKSRRER